MRGAVAVPPESGEQLLRHPVRRTAIARGQDAAEAVAPVGIGLDAPAQVVGALRRIEEGVAALGIGMPDIDDGPRHWLALGVPDLTVDEQHLALFRVLVQPRLALFERRVGDVERALNGAR